MWYALLCLYYLVIQFWINQVFSFTSVHFSHLNKIVALADNFNKKYHYLDPTGREWESCTIRSAKLLPLSGRHKSNSTQKQLSSCEGIYIQHSLQPLCCLEPLILNSNIQSLKYSSNFFSPPFSRSFPSNIKICTHRIIILFRSGAFTCYFSRPPLH